MAAEQNELLTLEEIQKAELEILKQFHCFCVDHSLKYSLSAGSLLGLIRHHGFIPWDDDVDVFMPRDDFEIFQNLYYNERRSLPSTILFQNGLRESYPFTHGKLVDRRYGVNLEYVESYQAAFLGIDIFPIDGIPSGKLEKACLYGCVNLLRRLFDLAWSKPGKGKTKAKGVLKYLLKPLARILSADRLSALIDKICRRYTLEGSILGAPVSSTIYGKKEYVPSHAFDDLLLLRFEDSFFYAIRSYHAYLTRIYGDYLIIPDSNQRKKHYLQVTKLRKRG